MFRSVSSEGSYVVFNANCIIVDSWFQPTLRENKNVGGFGFTSDEVDFGYNTLNVHMKDAEMT